MIRACIPVLWAVAAGCLVNGAATAATRFVDPHHPGAVNEGDGATSRPYASIAYAVSRLQRGDRLVLRGGQYREAIDLRAAPTLAGASDVRTISIEGAEGEEVVLLGSDPVTGWQARGEGLFVKRPWLINSQQVFVDGQPLQQVGGSIFDGFPQRRIPGLSDLHRDQGGIWPLRRDGGSAQLTAGSFHYDVAEQALYVRVDRTSLEGVKVEVSVRPYLVRAAPVNHLVLRNLKGTHSNTSALSRHGAIHLNGNHVQVENVHVSDCDLIGIVLHGDDNVMRDSSVRRCGQLGMHLRGHRLQLENNETSSNNTRGFNKWWEAGGVKAIGNGGLKDARIAGHRALFNQGDGIWFDWGNDRVALTGAIVAYNSGFGVHYEASRRGTIANNLVFGNGLRGIYVFQSADTVVARNLVLGNALEGIAVMDDARRDPQGVLDLQTRNNRIVGNVIAWNQRSALVLPVRPDGDLSDQNLVIAAQQPGYALGWPGRRSPRTLADWQKASGQDQRSVEQVRPMPASVQAALAQRRLDPDWQVVHALARQLTLVADAVPPEARALMKGYSGPADWR